MDQPINVQKYQSEVKVRARINKAFTLERADFPSLDAYNDYLEDVQSLSNALGVCLILIVFSFR